MDDKQINLPFEVSSLFGAHVFNDAVMRQRLPQGVYWALRKTMEEGADLDPAAADVVAYAMKDWAIELGATHFCHWFQPMTGMTAEKHDSFISPTPDGRTIMEFSGKELIRGEPDASSFPSGGLRVTFEARGYTAWDCTSPVFIKNDGNNVTLFIPSAFCSYTGHALDKKTPLLRSIEALNRQALRVLRALGNTTSKRVIATLGGEQEYFLVDRKFVEKRWDLILTGRTLLGAAPPKGQELEDHYFGSLHERVASFMHDVNRNLWRLGVSAKTQHNEVAPAQYEIAPMFVTVNVGVDHNQLTMDTLRKVARHHGFECLLHEKPFAGVNGSGKHNNWSLVTNDCINLLNPGQTPHENMQFLVFLLSVIRAVDKYALLLRTSVATPGNDHRLGANEAPPAIVSVFLGEQLTDIYEQLEKGAASSSKQGGKLTLGVSTLPPLPKDCTDRNRTSPFAFTGNKFEFRMVGSSQSLAGPNFGLNTMVADTLSEVADELEGASSEKELRERTQKLLSQWAKEHKRIIFNGDNYNADWTREAEKRGLPNIRNCVESLQTLATPPHEKLFVKHKVLTPEELHARAEILLEHYAKSIRVEARTMSAMVRRQILPAALRFAGDAARSVTALQQTGMKTPASERTLREINELLETLDADVRKLDDNTRKAAEHLEIGKRAEAFRDRVVPAMEAVRATSDKIESLTDAAYWPLPTYADMLFVR